MRSRCRDSHDVHRRFSGRDGRAVRRASRVSGGDAVRARGAFTYSPQEGTRAAQYPDDVHETVKRERLERLTELQRAITGEKYESRTGRTAFALVDRTDLARGSRRRRGSRGRLTTIDGVTQLDEALPPGTIAEVAVEEVVDDYDFQASVIRVALAPSAPQPRRVSRQLPISQVTIGSYGR